MFDEQFCQTHAYSPHAASGKYIVFKSACELKNTLLSTGVLEEPNESQDSKSQVLCLFESGMDQKIEMDAQVLSSLKKVPDYQSLMKELKQIFLELFERVNTFKTDIFYIIERGASNYHPPGSSTDITRARMKDVMAFAYKLCQDAQKEREYFLNYNTAAQKLRRAQLVIHFLKIDCFQRRALEKEWSTEGNGSQSIQGSVSIEEVKGNSLYSEKDCKILQKFDEMIQARLQLLGSEEQASELIASEDG